MTTLTNETLYGENSPLMERLIDKLESNAKDGSNPKTRSAKEAWVDKALIGHQLRVGNAFIVPSRLSTGNPYIDDVESNGTIAPEGTPLEHRIDMTSAELRKSAEDFAGIHFGLSDDSYNGPPVLNDKTVDLVHFREKDLGRGTIIFLTESNFATRLWQSISSQTQENLLLGRLESFSRNIAHELKNPTSDQAAQAESIKAITSPRPPISFVSMDSQ